MIKFRDENGNTVFKMNDNGELKFEDKKKEEEYNNIVNNNSVQEKE